ncbi:translation initiation factor IF-2 [Chloroflexota bacterium]
MPRAAKSGETTKATEDSRKIEIPASVSVRQLADMLGLTVVESIKQLMRLGIMANINQAIEYDTAAEIAAVFGYEAQPAPRLARKLASKIGQRQLQGEEASGLSPRPPVVTIMGHVDHGKTRLLDAIRKSAVMDSEAGGITQHIGASQVEINGQKITFLDTPGHEAFTMMRAHGANVTDITVLIVAADDGVMPQTLEAIDHARAAGVPIVVAINKIDKPDANPELAKRQLSDAGLLIEEWGGDIVCVLISAKENIGISKLLEHILLVAEIQELKANPSLPGEGVVIEAGMDRTRGPLATVLVQNGSLRLGDTIVVGTTWGRIKAMFNDKGKRIKKAEPATPVEILGLSALPRAGDALTSAADEHLARALIQENQRIAATMPRAVRLTDVYNKISAGEIKELNIILKTDVQGSIEPIRASLERLGMEKVKVRIIRSGSGNITESDVMLAVASKGLTIGFNNSIEAGARKAVETEGVDVRFYSVIYNLVDDVEKALKGLLEPTYVEAIEGIAEIRAVFSGGGKGLKIAGVYVTEGKLSRGAKVRVRREKKILIEATVGSLRRFKDDVKEVATGYEAGVGVKDYHGFQVGDMLEFFRVEKAGEGGDVTSH